jgi:hypothetical protein
VYDDRAAYRRTSVELRRHEITALDAESGGAGGGKKAVLGVNACLKFIYPDYSLAPWTRSQAYNLHPLFSWDISRMSVVMGL